MDINFALSNEEVATRTEAPALQAKFQMVFGSLATARWKSSSAFYSAS